MLKITCLGSTNDMQQGDVDQSSFIQLGKLDQSTFILPAGARFAEESCKYGFMQQDCVGSIKLNIADGAKFCENHATPSSIIYIHSKSGASGHI